MPLLVSLLAYVSYKTRGVHGQCAFPSRIMIPIQKQVIYLQGLALHSTEFLLKSDWSQATKVPYTFRNVLLAKFARSLELLSHS